MYLNWFIKYSEFFNKPYETYKCRDLDSSGFWAYLGMQNILFILINVVSGLEEDISRKPLMGWGHKIGGYQIMLYKPRKNIVILWFFFFLGWLAGVGVVSLV